MDSKQYILDSLRKNTKETFPKPEIRITHTTYPDKIAQFIAISEGVGGHAELLQEGETIDGAIARLFPEVKSIASNLPEVTCTTFNPDEVATPRDLNGTDLMVFRGKFGVCENGAVYYEQEFEHRAIYFIAERVLILLNKNELVDTMHEAYARIPKQFDGEFRGFISGPSKTADIEQALVKGAHGAKELTILLV